MSLGLGALMALAAAVPALTVGARDAELRSTLSGLGSMAAVTVVQEEAAGQAAPVSFDPRAQGLAGARLAPYFGTGSESAQLAPQALVSRNDTPLPGGPSYPRSSPGYMDGLSGHTRLIAGRMPRDSSPGVDLQGIKALAATMAQSAADRLGVNLSDQLCLTLDPASGQAATRCFVLVGVWKPLSASDPYWQSTGPAPELMLGRSDFLALLAGLDARATVRINMTYPLVASKADSGTAADLAARIQLLRQDLKRIPRVHVQTELDKVLTRLVHQPGWRDSGWLLQSLAGLLALSALALVSAAFLTAQDREVRLVANQGWPGSRALRLILTELALLPAPAAIAGLALGAIAGTGFVAVHYGVPVRADGVFRAGSGAALIAAGAAALVTMLVLATRSVARALAAPQPAGPARGWRSRGRPVAGALAIAGLLLLGLGRLQLPDRGGILAAVVLAAGLLLLAAAATTLMRHSSALVRGSTDDPASAVAAWQLARQPGGHAGAAVALTLAVAAATFAAMDASLGGPQTLHTGLALIAILAVVAAVAGFGAHFAATLARRGNEHPAPPLSGVSRHQLATSLAKEQMAVLTHSLLAGVLLGVVFAVAAIPEPGPAAGRAGLPFPAGTLAMVGLAIVPALVVLAGGLGIGWMVRRAATRLEVAGGRRRLA